MDNLNTISGEAFAESAEESIRRATAAEAPAPETGDVKQVTGEVVAVPNPFILQSLGQLIGKGLELSKKAGWSSPEAPPVLTEEKWKQVVTENTAVVIARRFPRLNDDASEEFALLVLVGPWLVMNLIGMFWRMYLAKKQPPTEDKPPIAEPAA